MLLGNPRTIGIDLGTTGVRVAEVAWKDGRPVLERWAATDFETEVTDWTTCDAQGLSQLLRSILEKQGFRDCWASHAVAGDAVAPQYFSFPKLLPEDVPEAVRIEVEGGLPFRVEDALISYVLFPDIRVAAGATEEDQPATETAGVPGGERPEAVKSRTHGLAIAADQGFVESRLNVIRLANVETFCVETDATACGNAFIATGGLNGDAGATAILDIGHRYVNLALLGEGTILVRDIPSGGAQVTKAISEMLSVSENEAERLKRAHWERGPEAAGPLDNRMREVLDASLQELCDRLLDTVQYWAGERLVPGLGRVLITGGGSQIRELPEMLSRVFGVPVERWHPLDGIGHKPKKRLAPWVYRMTVAFGLALRRVPRSTR